MVLYIIVDKTGRVKNIEIVRDIGAGCGKEAKQVVEEMNDLPERWKPGRQRGKPVNVKYTLPIKFKLN